MRNKLIALLLAAALALCACGGGKGAEEPEQENTSLYVVTSYGPDDGNRKNFEAAVRAYEEATGNHVVDGSGVSNEEWKTKVMTDFMTGSEPDVLFYFTNADADPFINAGRVVPIEEIRQVYPDYATNMKEAMMSVAADGKHYAVPSNGYWKRSLSTRAYWRPAVSPSRDRTTAGSSFWRTAKESGRRASRPLPAPWRRSPTTGLNSWS